MSGLSRFKFLFTHTPHEVKRMHPTEKMFKYVLSQITFFKMTPSHTQETFFQLLLVDVSSQPLCINFRGEHATSIEKRPRIVHP